ncbi:MAG: PAS domain-containing protein, partial [Thiogranum sp.]|nr:PAS domain-containing protein [Thiogranum sp.]
MWSSESVARIREVLSSHSGLLPFWLYVEAVEQSPVAISITDDSANILYVNKAFTDVTGYLPKQVIGENESILSDKTTPRHVYRELWYRITHKQVWHGLLVNRHKN